MFLQNTKGETKTGIQAEKKGWWPGFILRIQKACLVTKKRGLSEESLGFQDLRFRKTSGPD